MSEKLQGVDCPAPHRASEIEPGVGLPLVVEPGGSRAAGPAEFRAWLGAQRDWLAAALAERGGVLFRGFRIEGAAAFESCVAALAPSMLPYVEGQSQRSRVHNKVYTSTEYPAGEDITLHNELSYVSEPPRRIYFFCDVAPEEGGETPIADGRRALRAMDSGLRGRFEVHGVRYVKNMHGGNGFGGKSWQEHFETSDRAEVEAYLKQGGVEYRWKDDGTLWTSQRRPATIEHPETGERVWFNQSDLWHYTNLGTRGDALLRLVGEDGLPTNAYFGDGTPIPAEDVAAVRSLFWEQATIFPWRRGDFLVLDNLLVAHGRRAYRGERRILVAMSS